MTSLWVALTLAIGPHEDAGRAEHYRSGMSSTTTTTRTSERTDCP